VASQQSETASELRRLADYLQRAHADFCHAAILAVNYASICSGPPEEFCIVPQLAPFGEISAATEWLIKELRIGARSCDQIAKYCRSLTTQKPEEWGPNTQKVVNSIVRATEAMISDQNFSRKAKPKRQARYYAGLLCMRAGLLVKSQPDPETVSENVRKRLARGKRLLQAVKEHETRYGHRHHVARESVTKF
jgi:hypothetical protein